MGITSSPRRIVILQGHPDHAARHLLHALAEAYSQGAIEAGHSVRMIEIAELKFPLLRSQIDFEKGSTPVSLQTAQELIAWAEHLVIFFPLWLGTMPALLKAFLEQVFRPGFAFRYVEGGLPKKLLQGRSARVVVTMGMPTFVYRWYFLAHGLRGLERNILRFVGIKPVRENLFGSVEAVGSLTREKWLRR